jgi:hypothetical protein
MPGSRTLRVGIKFAFSAAVAAGLSLTFYFVSVLTELQHMNRQCALVALGDSPRRVIEILGEPTRIVRREGLSPQFPHHTVFVGQESAEVASQFKYARSTWMVPHVWIVAFDGNDRVCSVYGFQ